nr:MAG TPA_asm: hypothetical protein [Caudoviricetes sp.]
MLKITPIVYKCIIYSDRRERYEEGRLCLPTDHPSPIPSL